MGRDMGAARLLPYSVILPYRAFAFAMTKHSSKPGRLSDRPLEKKPAARLPLGFLRKVRIRVGRPSFYFPGQSHGSSFRAWLISYFVHSIKEPDMAELKSDLLAAKEEITAFQSEKKEPVRLNP